MQPFYRAGLTALQQQDLRRQLVDNHTGVIAGIHGLGGIGKTELAFTYAPAYAGVYPGGR